MWKSALLLLVVATPALAGNKRLVDVSFTYTRTLKIDSTDERTGGPCTTTDHMKTNATFSAQVAVDHVEIIDDAKTISVSLPNKHEKAMSGTGQLQFAYEEHKTHCDDKTDIIGDASSTAEAKAVHVGLSFGKKTSDGTLSLSMDFPTPKANGKITETSKSGSQTLDYAPFMQQNAAMQAAAYGQVALQTATMIDHMPPQLLAIAHRTAQDNPIAVKTVGDAIDVDFIEETTTNLAKEPPPPQDNEKKGGTMIVTTEVHLHITPAKK